MPSKVHHNTLLEVAWTLIPVIILVFIAVPSFRLLYMEATIPTPDVHIKAIGKQWFWTYEYPGANAGFTYDSLGLSDADAAKAGKPRLLGTENIRSRTLPGIGRPARTQCNRAYGNTHADTPAASAAPAPRPPGAPTGVKLGGQRIPEKLQALVLGVVY